MFPSPPSFQRLHAWIAGALLLFASLARAQDPVSEYGTPPVAPEPVGMPRAAVMREEIPGVAGKIRHRFTCPDGGVVEFEDRPKGARDTARRERVLSYVGRNSAAME